MRTTPLVLAFALLAAGCGRGPVDHTDPERLRIVEVKSGDSKTWAEVLDDLATVDIVYVGESHDNQAHHEIQLMVLRGLAERREGLGLGMEMFQEPYQDAIDEYLSYEIGEVAMLRRTEWRTRWGFPWELYAPMVRFAREEGLKIVALNASRELTRTVARNGLDALTEEQRKELPELDLTNEEHRAYVRKAFDVHPMPEERWEGFYTAQVIWDEKMAERTADYVINGGESRRPIVVIAGIGHVAGGMGIPSRVKRRIDASARVIVPVSTAKVRRYVDQNQADYLWVAP